MNLPSDTPLNNEESHESPLLRTVCRYPAGSAQMNRRAMNRKTETAYTVLSQYSG